jgi:hypothetical protein
MRFRQIDPPWSRSVDLYMAVTSKQGWARDRPQKAMKKGWQVGLFSAQWLSGPTLCGCGEVETVSKLDVERIV